MQDWRHRRKKDESAGDVRVRGMLLFTLKMEAING
jgi:hypothetical protein